MRTAISASNEEFDGLISCPATSVLILHKAHSQPILIVCMMPPPKL